MRSYHSLPVLSEKHICILFSTSFQVICTSIESSLGSQITSRYCKNESMYMVINTLTYRHMYYLNVL